jgi:shikimate dehydrogenase
VGTAADIAQANVLINATSVGMGESNSPVDSKDLHAGLVVLDAVYHPLETQLLRDAKNIGATTVDGLWMLVHQGALQQSSWLGVSGDIRIMREAAVDALAQRDK